MFSLTKNEIRTINFLVRNYTERISINGIARQLSLSPMGAYKILKRLEQHAILEYEKIGNAIHYQLNLSAEGGKKAAELALTNNILNPFAKVCVEDLQRLKPLTLCAALFGSVLAKGMNANDIDIFCVIKPSKYKELKAKICDWQKSTSKKIHLLVQTKDDLLRNMKNKDPVIEDILKTGAFFWGEEIIIEAIRQCQK